MQNKILTPVPSNLLRLYTKKGVLRVKWVKHLAKGFVVGNIQL